MVEVFGNDELFSSVPGCCKISMTVKLKKPALSMQAGNDVIICCLISFAADWGRETECL